jgi:hypothetical protein
MAKRPPQLAQAAALMALCAACQAPFELTHGSGGELDPLDESEIEPCCARLMIDLIRTSPDCK